MRQDRTAVLWSIQRLFERQIKRVDPRTVTCSGMVWLMKSDDGIDVALDIFESRSQEFGAMLGAQHDAIVFGDVVCDKPYFAFLWTNGTLWEWCTLVTDVVDPLAENVCSDPAITMQILWSAYAIWINDYLAWLKYDFFSHS